MRHTVTVVGEWRSRATFEFDSAEEAERFREEVNSIGSRPFQAMEANETAELDTSNAELINWEAGEVKEDESGI